jgi:hypothetical protein
MIDRILSEKIKPLLERIDKQDETLNACYMATDKLFDKF